MEVIRGAEMTYFTSRDIASIALLATTWGILNSTFAPIFFRMTGLPLLCDLVGFSVLALTVWWTRKLGAVSAVGAIATVINFTLNPGGVHFLGFTAASIIFDAMAYCIGYKRSFRSKLIMTISILAVSIISAAFAGFIIGSFFMAPQALTRWGGVLGWAGLHAIGGFIGGTVGVIIIVALTARGIHKAEEVM
ncbi:MAG: hypothetical protein QXR17_03955 [Candidatus Bathyarchaeia archaeon]